MQRKKHKKYRSILHRPIVRGFTLVEVLIVIGILAFLMAITLLVINPVEYLRQGRDAKRIGDVRAIRNAINLAYTTNPNLDFDGPNYTNSCKGQSNQKVFMSVPNNNGETAPSLPSGWSPAQVPSAELYKVDGNGWLPIDFANPNAASIMSTLPIDPINTFASGYYYTFVCGSFEIDTALESSKYAIETTIDGGDDDSLLELGTSLFDMPPRNTGTSTPGGSVSVSSILPSGGTNDGATIATISGTGFQSGAIVKLTKSGQLDIVGTGFAFSSSTQLSNGSFDLTGASAGNWNVVVTNTDNSSSSCANCFTVTQAAVGGTVTATFTFDADLGGFVNSSCTHSATCARIATDGNPGTGALEVDNSNKNKNTRWQWDYSGTWESLGVPAGKTVTAVDGKYNHIASAYIAGDTSNTDSGDLTIYQSNGNTVIATLETGVSYNSTTAWATRDAAGAVSIPVGSQASNTSIVLTLAGRAYTNNTNGASVILRQDQIVLTITYVN